jgi:hypothetical protein
LDCHGLDVRLFWFTAMSVNITVLFSCTWVVADGPRITICFLLCSFTTYECCTPLLSTDLLNLLIPHTSIPVQYINKPSSRISAKLSFQKYPEGGKLCYCLKELCMQCSHLPSYVTILPSLSQLAQMLTLLTYLQEVPDSNFIQGINYPDWGILWFSSVPPVKCQDSSSMFKLLIVTE